MNHAASKDETVTTQINDHRPPGPYHANFDSLHYAHCRQAMDKGAPAVNLSHCSVLSDLKH